MDPPKVDTEMAFAMQNTFLGISTCRREGEVRNLQSQRSKGSLNPTGSSEAHTTPVSPRWAAGVGSSCPTTVSGGLWAASEAPVLGEASLHLRQLGRSCELGVRGWAVYWQLGQDSIPPNQRSPYPPFRLHSSSRSLFFFRCCFPIYHLSSKGKSNPSG